MNATRTRPARMPKFVPRSYKSLADTAIDTNEALDASETGIDCDADATSAIPIGTIIRIDDEFMSVTATGTTLTVARGAASSTPATHVTNSDIYKIQTSNCVLWLPGQDDPQSATIRDRSGYGNHGTLTGATWVRNSKGLWVLSFDGVDDYIEIASNGVGKFDVQSYTIEAWVWTTTLADYIFIWSYDFTSHSLPYYAQHLRIDVTGAIFFGFNIGAVFKVLETAAGIFLVNTWQYVVAKFESGSQKIYLNGVEKGSNTEVGIITYYTQAVWIGRTNPGYIKAGRIGMVRFYNRTLSASEIMDNFNRERSLFGV